MSPRRRATSGGPRRVGGAAAAACVAVLLVLSACGSEGGGEPDEATDPSAPATSERDAGAPDEGEDVTLRVAVDVAGAGAVAGVITPSTGGTLETAGADGTRYRLEVPPGAVPADTPITMTPLAAVTGDLVDGLVGGVDLGPDGLQLGAMATLTIEPARDVAVEAQVPFGYEGEGTELVLAPMDPDPGRVAVWVGHFSGYGVLESTDARMELNRRLAAAEAERASTYLQRMAQVFADARVDAESGAGPDRLDAERHAQLRAIQEEYLHEHLQGRLEYAERLSTSGNPGDLEYIRDVLGEMLALERMTQLLGTDSLLPEAWNAITSRIDASIREGMHARCVEENDFTVLPVLVEIERSLQLLGAAGEGPGRSGCAAFELRFTSELQILGPWPDLAGTVDASVPVDLTGLGEGPDGVAPLPWTWEGRDSGCSVEARQSQVGDLTVLSIAFDLPPEDARYRADGRLAPPEDVVMVYDVGVGVTEVFWEDCQQTHGYWQGDYVRDAWTALHAQDAWSAWWVADEWEMLFDGPLVARKVYEQRVGDLEICFEGEGFCWPLPVEAVETTTLELVHTPR